MMPGCDLLKPKLEPQSYKSDRRARNNVPASCKHPTQWKISSDPKSMARRVGGRKKQKEEIPNN